MTERELLDAILEVAGTFGWRVMHPRPARTAHGWRTAVQGPGAAGFPDLVLLGGTAGSARCELSSCHQARTVTLTGAATVRACRRRLQPTCAARRFAGSCSAPPRLTGTT